MSFQDFCERIATPEPISIVYSSEVPDELVEPLNVLVNQMRSKMTRLDRIEVVFIQNKFLDMEHVCNILDNHYNGEVDDSLATVLSQKLYRRDFNSLNIQEMAIIKVMAIYLMLLKHFNEE